MAVYYYGGALERDMAAGEFLVYLLFVAFNLTVSGRLPILSVFFARVPLSPHHNCPPSFEI